MSSQFEVFKLTCYIGESIQDWPAPESESQGRAGDGEVGDALCYEIR